MPRHLRAKSAWKAFFGIAEVTGWFAYELVQPNPDGTLPDDDANGYEDLEGYHLTVTIALVVPGIAGPDVCGTHVPTSVQQMRAATGRTTFTVRSVPFRSR